MVTYSSIKGYLALWVRCQGVRNFRVVNVGAWADTALAAIDAAAAKSSRPTSVPRAEVEAVLIDRTTGPRGVTGTYRFLSLFSSKVASNRLLYCDVQGLPDCSTGLPEFIWS